MHTYFCVASGYFTHRKTMRLIKLLRSDVAALFPLRLWEYASLNQKNGDFSKYTPDELAPILRVPPARVGRVRSALVDAGFLDRKFRLHDWHYWNAYFIEFATAEKLSRAAKARWRKERGRGDKPPPTESESKTRQGPESFTERNPSQTTAQSKGNSTPTQTLWKLKSRAESLGQLIAEHPAKDVEIYPLDGPDVRVKKKHDIAHLGKLKTELRELHEQIAGFKE